MSKTVAEICNRLSQYLNEKGSLVGLGIDLTGKLEPKGSKTSNSSTSQTKIIFDKMEISEEKPAKHGLMDLFPQHAGVSFPKYVTNNDIPSKPAIVENDTAPMNIFYGGKLFVFNDIPAEKVGDIIELATRKSQVKKVGSDLPIMRKAPLHRFAKNRKDRVVARVPYQKQGSPLASYTNHEEELSLKL